ncbi:MAG: hypothetical protein ACE5FH_03785 [Candidatus Zixiibacteriota bacterium]
MSLRLSLSSALLFIIGFAVQAHTRLNPDISAIGDLRAFSHNDDLRPEEADQVNLDLPEMELYVNGYLNPYAKADISIAWHEGETAEIEELYATFLRGLPLDINLRVGRQLIEFGRLNPVHEHAWSFLKRPLAHEAFFGDEGLVDMAVRASVLLPTGGAFTELMAGLLKGDALIGHHLAEGPMDSALQNQALDSDVRPDLGLFGRLTSSLAVSGDAELAFGVTAANSVYDIDQAFDSITGEAVGAPMQHRSWLGGIDIKYKYKPSRVKSLQVELEGLVRRDKREDGENLVSYGGYGYIDYRFRQRYNVGAIAEWTSVEKAKSGNATISKDNNWRGGLFAGFSPVEETSMLRLAGHWTEPEDRAGFWEITLQLVFSLGPHQPHNF